MSAVKHNSGEHVKVGDKSEDGLIALKDSLRFARAELVRLQGVVDAVDHSLIADVLRDIDESLAKAEGKS